jgi:hypothetical protein
MRILRFITVMLYLSSLAAAQSATPLQTGFAVITPASQIAGNLLVSETLINSDGQQKFHGGIEATPLVTNVMFLANNAPLLRDTGLAVVNPNNTAATLTLVLRNNIGNVTVCRSVVVPARQQLSRFLSEIFKDQGFILGTTSGLLSISSTQTIGLVGLQFSGASFNTIPLVNRASSNTLTPESCSGVSGGSTFVTSPLLTEVNGGLFPVPTYAPGVGGPGAILLTQYVNGGTWKSEIVIANVSTVPQLIRVDFFSATGGSISALRDNIISNSFTNVTIAPGGFVSFSSVD